MTQQALDHVTSRKTSHAPGLDQSIHGDSQGLGHGWLANQIYGLSHQEISQAWLHTANHADVSKHVGNLTIGEASTDKSHKVPAGSGEYFSHKLKELISAQGVGQKIGDCYFESTLASLANSNKGARTIENMITENKQDGSYVVTFPGDRTHPVTVSAADLTTNFNNGQIKDPAIWARVIETAFLKYDHCEQYGGLMDGPQLEGVPFFGKINNPADAANLLTGERSTCKSLGNYDWSQFPPAFGATSSKDVAALLEGALKNGEPVTAGTVRQLGANDCGPLANNHEFSVLGYDGATDMVTVRNPWSRNHGDAESYKALGIKMLADGKLEMPLSTFCQCFNHIYVPV
jgi:hypothetical protein